MTSKEKRSRNTETDEGSEDLPSLLTESSPNTNDAKGYPNSDNPKIMPTICTPKTDSPGTGNDTMNLTTEDDDTKTNKRRKKNKIRPYRCLQPTDSRRQNSIYSEEILMRRQRKRDMAKSRGVPKTFSAYMEFVAQQMEAEEKAAHATDAATGGKGRKRAKCRKRADTTKFDKIPTKRLLRRKTIRMNRTHDLRAKAVQKRCEDVEQELESSVYNTDVDSCPDQIQRQSDMMGRFGHTDWANYEAAVARQEAISARLAIPKSAEPSREKTSRVSRVQVSRLGASYVTEQRTPQPAIIIPFGDDDDDSISEMSEGDGDEIWAVPGSDTDDTLTIRTYDKDATNDTVSRPSDSGDKLTSPVSGSNVEGATQWIQQEVTLPAKYPSCSQAGPPDIQGTSPRVFPFARCKVESGTPLPAVDEETEPSETEEPEAHHDLAWRLPTNRIIMIPRWDHPDESDDSETDSESDDSETDSESDDFQIDSIETISFSSAVGLSSEESFTTMIVQTYSSSTTDSGLLYSSQTSSSLLIETDVFPVDADVEITPDRSVEAMTTEKTPQSSHSRESNTPVTSPDLTKMKFNSQIDNKEPEDDSHATGHGSLADVHIYGDATEGTSSTLARSLRPPPAKYMQISTTGQTIAETTVNTDPIATTSDTNADHVPGISNTVTRVPKPPSLKYRESSLVRPKVENIAGVGTNYSPGMPKIVVKAPILPKLPTAKFRESSLVRPKCVAGKVGKDVAPCTPNIAAKAPILPRMPSGKLRESSHIRPTVENKAGIAANIPSGTPTIVVKAPIIPRPPCRERSPARSAVTETNAASGSSNLVVKAPLLQRPPSAKFRQVYIVEGTCTANDHSDVDFGMLNVEIEVTRSHSHNEQVTSRPRPPSAKYRQRSPIHNSVDQQSHIECLVTNEEFVSIYSRSDEHVRRERPASAKYRQRSAADFMYVKQSQKSDDSDFQRSTQVGKGSSQQPSNEAWAHSSGPSSSKVRQRLPCGQENACQTRHGNLDVDDTGHLSNDMVPPSAKLKQRPPCGLENMCQTRHGNIDVDKTEKLRSDSIFHRPRPPSAKLRQIKLCDQDDMCHTRQPMEHNAWAITQQSSDDTVTHVTRPSSVKSRQIAPCDQEEMIQYTKQTHIDEIQTQSDHDSGESEYLKSDKNSNHQDSRKKPSQKSGKKSSEYSTKTAPQNYGNTSPQNSRSSPSCYSGKTTPYTYWSNPYCGSGKTTPHTSWSNPYCGSGKTTPHTSWSNPYCGSGKTTPHTSWSNPYCGSGKSIPHTSWSNPYCGSGKTTPHTSWSNPYCGSGKTTPHTSWSNPYCGSGKTISHISRSNPSQSFANIPSQDSGKDFLITGRLSTLFPRPSSSEVQQKENSRKVNGQQKHRPGPSSSSTFSVDPDSDTKD